MNKQMVFDKLNELGLDVSLSGFNLLIKFMDALPDNHADVFNTYSRVADECGCTSISVERNIRHLIERFYATNDDIPYCLRGNLKTGKLTNGQFACKLKIYLKNESGVLPDGTGEWAILRYDFIDDKYVVKKYFETCNYNVFNGTHDECVEYIENGGFKHAV